MNKLDLRLDTESVYKPLELLWRKGLSFDRVTRAREMSFFDKLGEYKKNITFSYKAFDPVCSLTTEKEQSVGNKQGQVIT